MNIKEFKKYYFVFRISIIYELSYKATLVMWRFRNVIQMLLVYFIWDVVYPDNSVIIFGYDRAKMLTYVFGLIFVRALVLSVRAGQISTEIIQGDLNNFLIKPYSYFKYWFTRDLSSKILNVCFALLEGTVLYLILKPSFFIQTNPFMIIAVCNLPK